MRLADLSYGSRLLLVAVVLLLAPSIGFTANAQTDGVRIDVPADGQIKIENRFGSVSMEVWSETYVLVSASIGATQKSLVTSPIVIDNRNKLLSISVVRRPVDPVAVIDLFVKIPQTSRVEVATTSGAVSLKGMPQSVSLKSVSGEVRALLLEPANVDVLAKSVSGIVNSDLASGPSGGGHVLETRLGTGGRALQINTDSGPITLTSLASSAPVTGDRASQPSLAATDKDAKAAGTPAGNENEEISEGDVVRVDSQLVTLNMSVIDRNTNRGVQGLTQSDFTTFEDGVEQRIIQFDAASAPFDLFLVIDLSGSTKDVLKLIREAALRFVEAARPLDRIAVVTFAGKPSLVSQLTLDRGRLRERINGIETAAGDTKLYDATDFTLEEISKERTKTRRTAIVLMSDGLDGSIPGVQGDGSKLSYKELRSRVQEFDGVLYTLWLNTEYEAMNPLDTQPEAFDAGYDRMKELADDGGGIFYEVERLEQLAGAYEHVVADLGTVYSIAYRPSNKARDGHWRALRVVVGRPNAIARGKRGYYAN
ncbi:MAG TPA: VWA domain-containing protein [Pyrinomonadaceae bacterium]|nr:VWA domain-containing protein [Pyrinomonadaceae bacterium]